MSKFRKSKKDKLRDVNEAYARSRYQEKEIADKVGGNLVPRSGAGVVKGDARVKSVVRIECKTTSHKSFSVTKKMIEKIESAALNSGELPIVVIEFLDEHGNPDKEVAVCPTYVLSEFIKE